MSDPFDLLGIAAMKKLKAQDALDEANRELAEAVRLIHRAGQPKCWVGQSVRTYLDMHGFDEELRARLAVSNGSIRNMLDAG